MLDDRNQSSNQKQKTPESGAVSRPGVPDLLDDEQKESFEAMKNARQGSFLDRMNQAFQDVLQNSRGSGRERAPAQEAGDDPFVTADDLAMRRARTVSPQRMVIPEGVIIDGSLTSGSETEIAGRIEGDVTVDGVLTLGASALVTGNVRASSLRVDGLVDGRVECSQDLDLGASGRLNGDVLAGKRMNVGGQVFGNISSGGLVRFAASAKITGDLRARSIVIEEGAIFNGHCVMRPPAQRGGDSSK